MKVQNHDAMSRLAMWLGFVTLLLIATAMMR